MLVIHPYDNTTDFLRPLYEGREDVRLLTGKESRKEHLHGLFSGMIVSEMNEAQEYNIACSQEDLDRENSNLAERLRALFGDGVPSQQIPSRLAAMDAARTQLTMFNYNNFFCL